MILGVIPCSEVQSPQTVAKAPLAAKVETGNKSRDREAALNVMRSIDMNN